MMMVCEVYVVVVGAGLGAGVVGFGLGVVVGACVAEIVKTEWSLFVYDIGMDVFINC